MRNRARKTSVIAALIAVLAALLTFPGARPAAAAGAGMPSLAVDPGYIYVSVAPGETAEADVYVRTDTLTGLYQNAGWLTADTDRLLRSGTVRFTASAAGMQPGEVRAARVEFSAYPVEVIVPVVMVVGGGQTPPPVAASPARIDFGTISGTYAPSQYANLAFSTPPGAGTTVTADADWFQVNAEVAAGGMFRRLAVAPVSTKVAPGHKYAGNIVVRTGSQPPFLIPVSLEVASPEPPAPPAPPAGTPEQPGPFRDVPAGHWAADAIGELTAAGVIRGLGDGRFGPDDPVTREQFAKLLVLGLGLPLGDPPRSLPFPDVSVDSWSAPYIAAATAYMPKFKDGQFHPDWEAVREEIAYSLAVAKGMGKATDDLDIYFSDAARIYAGFRPYVAAARAAGLISGFPDRTFRPQAPVTRAEVAVMLQRTRLICGNASQTGCARPLGSEDRSLLGVTLKGQRSDAEAVLGQPGAELPGYVNAYTRTYRQGQVQVAYVTPSQQVWSVQVTGEGATPRGVAIGDSVAAVRKAYGPAEVKDGALVYRAGVDLEYFSIKFVIVAGEVYAIKIEQSK